MKTNFDGLGEEGFLPCPVFDRTKFVVNSYQCVRVCFDVTLTVAWRLGPVNRTDWHLIQQLLLWHQFHEILYQDERFLGKYKKV